MRRTFIPLGLAACLVAGACGGSETVPLHVAAAVSLSEALERASRRYEQATGDQVTLNFAASNVLSRQIEEGARVDVFISADQRQVERLVVRNLVAADSWSICSRTSLSS